MMRSIIAVAAVLALSAWLPIQAQQDEPRSRFLGTESLDGPATDSDGRPQKTRLREGAALTNELGKFRVTGDRITFYPSAGQDSYRTLENQALQRVAQVMDESREAREWSVTGLLTEFRGSNYLLLHRAVLKAKAATP